MKLTQNADLSQLNTFGVPARAEILFEIESEEDLLEIPRLRHGQDLVLGGGSNILFVDDVPGHLILNRIGGIALLEQDSEHLLIEAGAGENWHGLVCKCVNEGWHGLENLALIPGLAGAAPIQNIGAYGAELSEVLHSVTAWDWQNSAWTVLTPGQCRLGYRDSIFKQEPGDRYFITSIQLRLAKKYQPKLDYSGLEQAVLAVSKNPPFSAKDVFSTVVALRQEKLPDPAVQGNAGSFFKNPVLEHDVAEQLLQRYADLPHWPMKPNQVKLSAAALIQHCGLKGHQHLQAAVSNQHALVLVNLGGASGIDIWHLAQEVQDMVFQQFGVLLEPEPRIYHPRSR
jgi:UDP-N-acetylmuramate dehydrogenase